MNFRSLLGISFVSVVGLLGCFVVVLTVMFALFIELFLPFGKQQAWDWMKGIEQPVVQPTHYNRDSAWFPISGEGPWCITRAYQQTPQEVAMKHGRVEGFVRDASGHALAELAVHVSWDGDEGGITQKTDGQGRYEFILGPGEYHVAIAGGQSQAVSFRTNLREYYGHYIYEVDFAFCGLTQGILGPSDSRRRIVARPDSFAPLPIENFPRPKCDNGWGIHWFPTTGQRKEVVDKFIQELKDLNIRWVIVLQGIAPWDMTANDYLIERLVAADIMPVMRLDTAGVGDVTRVARTVVRYRAKGVYYFQAINEPNLSGVPVSEFVKNWTLAAQTIVANGGYPGFAPMSPDPNGKKDIEYFQAALAELKTRGRYDLINAMWISVHNYGDYTEDGALRYRQYDAAIQEVFGKGARLPMIGTEGGLEDANHPTTATTVTQMYQAMKTRDPYFFAYSPWIIGNQVGGGKDSAWENAAWFAGTLDKLKPRRVAEEISKLAIDSRENAKCQP